MPRFLISWNGIPHTDIALPQGKWKFEDGENFGAMLFQMVKTSRDMGITLAEFMALSDDEKAIQVSMSNLLSKMEQVNAQDRADSQNKTVSK